MEHFYWLIENAIGGRPGPHNVPWSEAELKEHGIGGVISLDGPIDPKPLLEVGIEHLPLYQPMICLENESDHLEFLLVMPKILKFLDRMQRERKATLVHCFHGLDRTGAVLANYLIARHKSIAPQAVDWVRTVNPEAMTAPGYEDVVYTFERLYHENRGWFEH